MQQPRIFLFALVFCGLASPVIGQAFHKEFDLALQNGWRANQVFVQAKANMQAWLRYKDSKSGLLPRLLPSYQPYKPQEAHYQVKDTAADLYPFLTLTAYLLDPPLYDGYMYEFLRKEIQLTTGPDGLPRDFFFDPPHQNEKNLAYNIFGASEYAKDGLVPITELLGKTAWSSRMTDLVEAIYANAPVETPFGKLPSGSAEVNGDNLQVLCRLYAMTGNEKYLQRAESIGDAYCFEVMPLNNGLPAHQWDFKNHQGEDLLVLRDHGCEIIGGLALLFAIERDEGRERGIAYYWPIRNMLDKIATTLNADGQFPNRIKCSDLSIVQGPLNDNWGYLYTAWWDFYLVTGEAKYKDAIAHALRSIGNYRNAKWEGRPADGYADSIEGAFEMVNRVPVVEAFDWIESEMQVMLGFQQKEGYIESWYGDGNWNRTVLMYALWKTQGCRLVDWDKDVSVGATMQGDSLFVAIEAKKAWQGKLCFDSPRHKTVFQFKHNYARINEFPEWFTVEPTQLYRVMDSEIKSSEAKLGAELIKGLPLALKVGKQRYLVVTAERIAQF